MCPSVNYVVVGICSGENPSCACTSMLFSQPKAVYAQKCFSGSIQTGTRIVSSNFVSMPKSYSEDLHWRAVWLHIAQGMSYHDISMLLYMSERSVQMYMEQFHTVDPTIQKRGPDKILSDFEQFTILQTLIHKPTSYLHEVHDWCLGALIHYLPHNQGARIHTQEGMQDNYPAERATPDSVYG